MLPQGTKSGLLICGNCLTNFLIDPNIIGNAIGIRRTRATSPERSIHFSINSLSWPPAIVRAMCANPWIRPKRTVSDPKSVSFAMDKDRANKKQIKGDGRIMANGSDGAGR